MTALRVSQIRIHPVKALRGYGVDAAVVEPRGFRWDRRYMVTTPEGEFLTQRDCHRMAPVTARVEPTLGGSDAHVVLHAAGERPLPLPKGPNGTGVLSVRVWDDRVMAVWVSRKADRWLSRVLERDVQLVFMPESTHRAVDPAYGTGDDIVSFADGYPYLAIGDGSLSALNARLEAPVSMERFRPNLTIEGAEPFAEDTWKVLRVGEVEFVNLKPCARCVVTTIDPDSGVPGREPLRTLAELRRRDGKVYMGVNLVPRGTGTIRVGDSVLVLETQADPVAPPAQASSRETEAGEATAGP